MTTNMQAAIHEPGSLCLHAWQHPGTHEIRYYLNGWLDLRLQVRHGQPGRITHAVYDGKPISLEQARQIRQQWRATKVWFDKAGRLYSGGTGARRLTPSWVAAIRGCVLMRPGELSLAG